MAFVGFPRELISFLRDLRAHNNREWFQAHYEDYQQYLVTPARCFVEALQPSLTQLGEALHAEPKIGGSILRLNRDIRFSKDKTPYRANLDLWFWQGDGPSRERPGYFLRLQPEELTLGAGMHVLPSRAILKQPDLDETVSTIPPEYEVHRDRGLYAEQRMTIPPEAFTREFPAFVDRHFRQLAPLQQWLVAALP